MEIKKANGETTVILPLLNKLYFGHIKIIRHININAQMLWEHF